MTLDSFHKSGISAISDTTQGVPRIKELLSLSKKIKTPKMYVYLEENVRNNYEIANRIADQLQFTLLEDIRNDITIYYDPTPMDVCHTKC